jgi:hypothetical protein
MADNKGTGHIAPDFTVQHDKKAAEAARKKLEGLREEEADLVQQLADKRREISLTAAQARLVNEPGFSNADGKKQRAATTKLEAALNEAATVQSAPAKTSEKK